MDAQLAMAMQVHYLSDITDVQFAQEAFMTARDQMKVPGGARKQLEVEKSDDMVYHT